MSIVKDTNDIKTSEITELELDKVEILNLFSKIKNSIDSLSFSKLKNNLMSSKFGQKQKSSLSLLTSEIENYANGDYLVSIIGRFSSGKSTLINALIGIDILPAEMDETTSVITKIKYGATNKIEILYSSKQIVSIDLDKNLLFQYLCKKGNNYSEDITEVIVYIPSEELQNGITIVDTPGLGSAFDLNNQIANSILTKSSAIIMAIDELGGREYLDIIEKIFQWNYDSYFTIIFAITKKDIIEDEFYAKEALLSLINKAREELQKPNITIPEICLISSKFELLYKQFQNKTMSLENIINKNKKMKLKSEDDVLSLHEESGFASFYKVLHQTILQSNIRKEQIKKLLLAVNVIVCGMHQELDDYLHYLEHYRTVEELEIALNEKIDAILEIEEQGNLAVSELQSTIEKVSYTYKKEKLDDLNDKIYCQMIDFIDSMPYEKLASNKFMKLIQELENVVMRETKAFSDNFCKEIDYLITRMLERLDDIIQRATEKELIRVGNVSEKESSIDANSIKIRSNNLGRAVFLSMATIPTAAAGGFMFGNIFFPGVGGLIGLAVFGAIGLVSNLVLHNEKNSEKKTAKIKESIENFLKNHNYQTRQIIVSIANGYLEYCTKVKDQLMEILKEEKRKRDNIISSFELEKENVRDNIIAIKKDVQEISPYIKEIGLLLAKYTTL